MGFSLKHLFHQSVNFNKNVFGGGYLRDALNGGGGNDQAGKVDFLSEQARSANAQNFAQSQVQRQRAIGDIQGGYAGAQNALNQGRTQALQAVSDQGAQASANATQGLVNSGFINSTIATNAANGISAGMSRAQANIAAAYAQMAAQNNIGQGNAIAQARQGIAGAQQAFGGSQAGLYQNHAGLINAQPEQDPNAWLESLLQIGGTAIGYGIGGPAGGAIGGAAASQFAAPPSGGIY